MENSNVAARSIGRATLETPDLQRELDHYIEIVGLVPRIEEEDRIVLSTTVGQEVLALEKGETPRLTKLAFQIQAGMDLAEAQVQLRSLGVNCERRSDTTQNVHEVLVFTDPCGIQIELYSSTPKIHEFSGSLGVAPMKLGHIAIVVPKAKPLVDFYLNALKFRVSDWMGDYFAFLRCGPDHHTLNFLDGEHTRMHHIAFELKDWAHVQSACELLGRKNKPIIWGPGRHGIGHNVFIYHRDPGDQIVEFYIEMDQISDETAGYFDPRPWHQDRPQRPKVWERMPAALTWGTPPTEEFLRTHFRRS